MSGTKAKNLALAAGSKIDSSGNVEADTLDTIDSLEFLRSDANGNVGIGGDAVSLRKLFIHGGSANRSDLQLSYNALGATNANGIQVGIQAAGGYIWNFETAENTGDIYFGTANTRKMTLTTGGSLGIGTNDPGEKLEVNGSFKIGNLKIQNANGGRIGFNRNTANGDIYDSNFAAFQINGAYSGADFMAFEAYTSGGVGTDAMAIKDNGNVGIGTTSPAAKLEISDSHGGNTGHSSYGHPVTGGSNGALYIDKANSRIDWTSGIVFCGEGTTWSARFTGRNGLNTNSDTDGEILGVHPVEGSSTVNFSDTAGGDSVDSAFFRVMGNGKTFVDKLYAEDRFITPSYVSDTAANNAGANISGSVYFNSTSSVHRSYNGSYWSNIGTVPLSESVFDAFGDGSAICLLKANNSNLDTGGTHNASLFGGASYSTTAKFGSHSFDAMGDGTYFDIPSLPMVETLSFWYYTVGGITGYLVDFRHDNPANGRSYLYTHSGAIGGTGQHIDMGDDTTTTNRTGVIYINGVQYTTGQYNFISGNWYHIVIVRNATDTHRTWDQGLRFGNRSDGTTQGNAGYFDQIRIFDRQITASEALALYNEIP